MTFKERVKMDNPSRICDEVKGGVFGCPSEYGYEKEEDEVCDGDCTRCWNREMPVHNDNIVDAFAELKKEESNDAVNHPNHYNRDSAMECIEEMVLVFGKQAVMNFCLCNAWKYRYRASDKNGAEDLRKSDWYMSKYKELNNNG